MRRNKLLLLFLVSTASHFAQVLKPEDAVGLALKNNFAVQVQKNNTEIAKNDATIGNAGMLPVVTLNASGTWANNDTKQNLLSGTVVNKKGAVSTGLNSGIGVNWVLFDGMKMFITYDRLKENRGLTETKMKVEMENTVASVLNSYYLLVKQKQLIKATENALLLYTERVKIAETKWKIGSSSKVDYLQAKVDMNALQSELLKMNNTLAEMKINLNGILSRAADEKFDVADSINIQYNPAYEDLKKSVLANNNSILLQQKTTKVAEYTMKELRSQFFPKISANANYNFSRSENQAGFILLNQNLGLNAGLTASWNIFNGGNVNRQVKNSQIGILNSKLLTDQAKITVETAVLKAYNNFKNAGEVLKLELVIIELAT